MLLAYIDEIGETGAFVSKEHARYRTSPAFGYAGFVIPEANARQFGVEFTIEKRRLFQSEIDATPEPGRWERKGADMFRPDTHNERPQHIRVFGGLVAGLERLGGKLFYYADEKPIGTPGQTQLDEPVRERDAMRETLNRLCTFAEHENQNIMVMLDQINERDRAKRLPTMYAHILSRATERQEMLRIVEPPMHIDSVLSSNIQFADWTAAAVSRAIDYHLIHHTRYEWVPGWLGTRLRGKFTFESKLHLWHRALSDFNHSDLVKRARPLYPRLVGHSIGDENLQVLTKIHEAAVRARARQPRRET